MKKIKIQNEATIKGTGNHTSKNAKAVICIDTGEIFTSAIDAADYMGVHYSAISSTCLGKMKTCKGMHFCYLSSALENLEAVVTRLREASAMEKDARKWREQEEAKEAARLAKEKRHNDIANLKVKIAKYEENYLKLAAKLTEQEKCLTQAQIELTKLLVEDEQDVA